MMTAKNILMSMVLMILIGQIYQDYQHNKAIKALTDIQSRLPATKIYCTWGRGHYDLIVDKNDAAMVSETAALLGPSIEGCE